MTSKIAIKKLAEAIFEFGELENGDGCLCPSVYVDMENRSGGNVIADVLYEKFHATHFSRVWQVKGKFVRIQLWKREAFGACEGGEIVYTETVNVSKKES